MANIDQLLDGGTGWDVTLNELINRANDGGKFYGNITTESTVPTTLKEGATVQPTEDGIYTYYLDSDSNSLEVEDEICVFEYISSAWVKKTIKDIENSVNLYGGFDKTYGYEGTGTLYTQSNTRINNQQIEGNVKINSLKVNGLAGGFFIFEVTKNEDGTFNNIQEVYSGQMTDGVNTFYFNDKYLSKGSYLAFYSGSTSLSASVSYTGETNEDDYGWVYGGVMLGDNNVVASSGINVDIFVSGSTLGINTLNDDIDNIYDKKTTNYGNALVGTLASVINWTYILTDYEEGVRESGYINTINCSALTAGTLSLLVYKKLDSGNFEFVSRIGDFEVSVGENNLSTNFYIESGYFIGFFASDAQIAYSTTGVGYGLSGYPTGMEIAFTENINKYALNIEINTIGLIETNENIRELENNKLEGVIVSIDDYIPTTGWTHLDWSSNTSPSVVNAILYPNIVTGMDSWIGRADIQLLDLDTTIVMCQANGGIYVTFSVETSKIYIHSSWGGDIEVIPAALVEGNIDVALTIGRDYIFEVSVDTVETLTATIYDKVTTESFSISHTTTGDADFHGAGENPLALIHKNGTYLRNSLSMTTPQKTAPQLLIYGDSYVVQYNLIRYGFGHEYRYANLIKEALDGNVCISATGGEDSNGLLLKLDTDFTMIKAKYTLLAIGLNDDLLSTSNYSEFKQNMTIMINKIKSAGSIPILCTYPRIKGDGIAASFNSWVRNYSGEKYVDFQKATSTTGEVGATPDLTTFFLDDGHPNIAGNQRYFDKFKLDCPYVFY